MNDLPDSGVRVVLPRVVEPHGLEIDSSALPVPAPHEVLLRMEATGVSFAEQQMRRGKYFDQPPFPFVPGYDLVGTVVAVGDAVSSALMSRRFAAVTKVGAWAEFVPVTETDLLPAPDDVPAELLETSVVNGITAWQMLEQVARVPDGGSVVVLGASGGVGGMLVQLAAVRGISVIGTASRAHHDALRAQNVTVVDSRAVDAGAQIRAIAPAGVDAVFDHVGGDGIVDSWRLVRRGGALVSYGTAATKDLPGSARLPILRLFARLGIWHALPNGRRATFYNFWAGRRRHPRAFAERQRAATSAVFDAVAAGDIVPRIAARFPLADAAMALALAESRTTSGKIVLTP